LSPYLTARIGSDNLRDHVILLPLFVILMAVPAVTMNQKNLWIAASDGDLERVRVSFISILIFIPLFAVGFGH